MEDFETNQWLTEILNDQTGDLLRWIDAFMTDRKVKGLAKGTLHFYKTKLKLFTDFLTEYLGGRGQLHKIHPGDINPNLIRAFLLHLEEAGHNPGGRHAAYRALRTLLYFWRDEVEPERWKNPFRKVAAPKIRKAPLPPIEVDEIQALIDACDEHGRVSERDKAIILSLADTGVRAAELLSIDLDDIDLVTGEVHIRAGKGNKPRFVFLGKKARKAIRRYLRTRKDAADPNPALWVTEKGNRLSYWGLREVIRRRALDAGIDPPGLHSFRRFFALACIRNKMNLHTLRRLMGHADLQVLQRYLALDRDDLQEGHRQAGPVDHSNL
jgi:site-specific recombinase XerD